MSKLKTIVVAVCVIALPSVSHAQALPFSDGKWELHGDSTRIETVDGRGVLRLTTGGAYRRDVSLLDGTIDADVKVTRRRSFVYLNFRMQTDEEHEEFYLRPHKSLLPDAVQYSPVYQGQSGWQLYHGVRGAVPVEIEPDKWQRLRIVLSGQRAAFFLGDTIKPFMVIPHLAREPKAGYIGLSGFLPGGTPGSGAIAYFSNVSVRPGIPAHAFDSVPPSPSEPAGVIRSWEVGEAFAASDTALSVIDPKWTASMKRVPTEPEGFVNLHRYVAVPPGVRQWGVVAKTTLESARGETRRLDLGFSDRITVFLNGRPVFNRDDSYDYLGRRDGLITPNQASVYLPLVAGRNEISVIVVDRFGGWAIMGSFPRQ